MEANSIAALVDIIERIGMVGVLAFMWYQERQEACRWQDRYTALAERLLKL